MTVKPRQPESRDKDEESDGPKPMDKFKTLARKLASVPRRELEQQQRRYEAEKTKRPKRD